MHWGDLWLNVCHINLLGRGESDLTSMWPAVMKKSSFEQNVPVWSRLEEKPSSEKSQPCPVPSFTQIKFRIKMSVFNKFSFLFVGENGFLTCMAKIGMY